MKKAFLFLAIFTIALGFGSCSKDGESPKDEPTSLRIASATYHESSDLDADVTTTFYSYDDSGRLIKEIREEDERIFKFTYSDSKVIISGEDTDGGGNTIETLTLNNIGLAISDDIIYLEDNSKDIITFSYNANGYMIKHFELQRDGDKYIIDYTIFNGNVIKEMYEEEIKSKSYSKTLNVKSNALFMNFKAPVIEHNSLKSTSNIYTNSYTYYLDKDNNYGYESTGICFLGKQNKNLVKSEVDRNNTRNYTYEYDSKGRVTKQICDDGSYTTYTYVE